jgi:hypothetical protein
MSGPDEALTEDTKSPVPAPSAPAGRQRGGEPTAACAAECVSVTQPTRLANSFPLKNLFTRPCERALFMRGGDNPS